MTTVSRDHWGLVATQLALAALLASALRAWPATTLAQGLPSPAPPVSEEEILRDSSLDLLETSVGGSYRTLSIRLSMTDGRATLSADKDGVKQEAQLATDEALALWKTVLAAGVQTLSDTHTAGMAADQSHFTVSMRAGAGANVFTVYGVDQLADTRYRDIIREILRVTDARVYGKTWRQ